MATLTLTITVGPDGVTNYGQLLDAIHRTIDPENDRDIVIEPGHARQLAKRSGTVLGEWSVSAGVSVRPNPKDLATPGFSWSGV